MTTSLLESLVQSERELDFQRATRPTWSRLFVSLTVFLLAACASTASAQTVEDGGRPAANPSRPTFSDNAAFVAEGWTELEAGYGVDFGVVNVQSLNLLLKYAILGALEARVGWDVVGWYEGEFDETNSGIGDVFFQGKVGIPLGSADPAMHQFAILGEVRPGIGQDPVSVPGTKLAAYAVYTTRPGGFQVDAQAGVELRGVGDDLTPVVPLSGVFSWSLTPWLAVFGEYRMGLTMEDLGDTEHSLLAGAAWIVRPDIVFDASVTVGLSDTVSDAALLLGGTFVLAPTR